MNHVLSCALLVINRTFAVAAPFMVMACTQRTEHMQHTAIAQQGEPPGHRLS
jgi:hypothetical protein